MMRGLSTTQNTKARWIRFVQSIHRMAIVALMSGVMLSSPLVNAWAAVHQCVDKAGKTVLTNRPTGLRHCRVIVEDPVTGSKTAAGRKSQNSADSIDSDTAPTFVDGLTVIPQQPGDGGYPRTESLNTAPSTPSTPSSLDQSCPPGVNPLNPLNDVPCNLRGDPQPSGMAAPR